MIYILKGWVIFKYENEGVFKLNEVNQKYDIGVVIIPKEKNREHLVKQQYPLIHQIA